MEINKRIPRHSESQCRARWDELSSVSMVKVMWTPGEDIRLLELQAMLGNESGTVARLMPGRNTIQCRSHWHHAFGPNSRWTVEEDRSLQELHAVHGDNWAAVSNGIPRHTDVWCQARWSWMSQKGKGNQPTAVEDSIQPKGRKPAKVLKKHAAARKSGVNGKYRAHGTEKFLDGKRKWSVGEDRGLIDLHSALGDAWNDVSTLIPVRNRL